MFTHMSEGFVVQCIQVSFWMLNSLCLISEKPKSDTSHASVQSASARSQSAASTTNQRQSSFSGVFHLPVLSFAIMPVFVCLIDLVYFVSYCQTH